MPLIGIHGATSTALWKLDVRTTSYAELSASPEIGAESVFLVLRSFRADIKAPAAPIEEENRV